MKMDIIDCLRTMDTLQVRAAVEAYSPRWAQDWEDWLRANLANRVGLLGDNLRKWQATRPYPMRRPKAEADHEEPFLDDLLAEADPHIRGLAGISMRGMPGASDEVHSNLRALWTIFKKLPILGEATEVGISKAVMLLTDGRIGPAFDSYVRKRVFGSDRRIMSADGWIRVLQQVGQDILAFEEKHGRLSEAVPDRFSRLECGRLYDMVFGPP